MVPKLDLSRARTLRTGDERLLRLLAAGIAGAALLGIAAYFAGGALAVLGGSLAAGYGITHLSGLNLEAEERLAFGAVIGAAATTMIVFLLALAFGFGSVIILAGVAIALAAGAAGFATNRRRVLPELLLTRSRLISQWPLWLLLLICWPFTLHLLGQAFIPTAGGLDAGFGGVYGDWAAHLTYAGSFAYGHNLPPQYPIDPGHRLGYPFLVDFFAATMVPLGTTLPSALVLSSGYLLLALPAVMYLAGVRFTGTRVGSGLGVLIFALAGGLGFLNFFDDLRRLGGAAINHLPRLYTQDVAHNYQLLTPVLAYLIPQRSSLFGFGIALTGTAILWIALNEEQRPGWKPFLMVGILAGIAPLFHVHGYGTLLVLGAFWAALDRRREWLGFLAPALLLGLPVVAWMLQPGEASPRWLLGWYADFGDHRDGLVGFWLKNTGIFIPLLLVAQFWPRLFPNRFALHIAPLWLWFVVPNLLVFQPWEWDNTKFFSFWLLYGSLLVGALLVRVAMVRRWTPALAVACFASLTMAGALDLARTADRAVSSSGFIDSQGLAAATWVREHTDPHATMLLAPNHNEPVAMLAGRPVLVGYGGWLWTYGLSDWVGRTADATTLLKGEPGSAALARHYGIRYVVIGPQETVAPWSANRAFWAAHGALVYSQAGYSIFRVG